MSEKHAPYRTRQARDRALADVVIELLGYMRGVDGDEDENRVPEARLRVALGRYLDRAQAIRDAGVGEVPS